MDERLKSKIVNLPEYQELLARRRQLNRPLVLVILIAYFGFILALAFDPKFLSIRVGEGVTTLGIVLGLVLIILTFAITGIFIHQTDGKISALLETIRNKVNGA